MAGEQHLHGKPVACRDALNQQFYRRNTHLPWLQSQAMRQRPNAAEYTTETCDFPYVTSRRNKTDREKSSRNYFSRMPGTKDFREHYGPLASMERRSVVHRASVNDLPLC
jgi:hypothetical protein